MKAGIYAFARSKYYLLTGLFMFLSFPSYDVCFLKGFPIIAWFALVPLFLYVRDKGLKEIYLSSVYAGLLGIFLAYRWIGDFGDNVPGGDYVILFFLVPSLAVVFATKILLSEIISRQFENVRFLVYPSIWIAVDALQSIGFLAFPWTYWGYSQYPFTAFIQLSSITGIFGVTFIIICASACIADCLHALRATRMAFAASLRHPSCIKLACVVLCVAGASVWGAYRLSHNASPSAADRLRVSIVQSCIDPWDDWNLKKFDNLNDLRKLTMASSLQSPEFVIWSESATLELISYDYRHKALSPFDREVLDIASTVRAPLLTGEIGVLEDPLKRRAYPQNNAVLINEYGEIVKSYPKINLVPFGEWFPYEKWLPLIKKIAVEFGGSNFVPGREPVLFTIKNKSFGPLICYEGIFFRLCRLYRNMGADFFVNITNLGWTDTYKGHMQGFASAKFRAIENGIWFVSAGNTGYTALVNPYGRVTESIPILRQGYLVGDLDFSLNHTTLYSEYGDVILYAAIAFLLVLAGVVAARKFMRKYAV